MAIRLILLGSISDTPRTLTYTLAGVPWFSFGVRVGTVRKRHYLIVSYATAARFADLFLRTGQRVRIEGHTCDATRRTRDLSAPTTFVTSER
jgi:hypothetical protein